MPKVCTRCGIEKEDDRFFVRHSRGKRILGWPCKECASKENIERRKNDPNAKEKDRVRYANNKEKFLAAGKAWRERNHERVVLQRKEYQASIKERLSAKFKKWYAEHKDEARQKRALWRLNNLDSARRYARKWEKENTEYMAKKSAHRRAVKLNATPSWANNFFIEEIYDLAKRRTKLKSGGYTNWHVDHIVPLKSDLVCGLHVEHNLQVIPGVDNLKKSNRVWPDMPEVANA